MSPLELTGDGAAAILATAPLEIVGRMQYSSNGTFFVRAAGEAGEIPAVYKPRRGERPLWDFPSGTLCQREVAAYEVSRTLGWGLVPCTVLRDGPLGLGAVQQFVDHDPDEHYFTLLAGREARFRQFALFDVVTNNTDRKGGHCLLDHTSGTVVGIDHGLTFHEDWKLRTVIWEFAGERLTAEEREQLECLLRELRDGPLGTTLCALLAPEEIEATIERTEGLLQRGLPIPDEGYRSVPWPLV